MSEARWMRVCPLADLTEGAVREVHVLARAIAVFNCAGRLWAVDGLCRHMRARLATGQMDGVRVTCARHGWTYDVTDGSCLTPGSEWARLATYTLKVKEGTIFVDAAPLFLRPPAASA
jgi:nitrite reductase/ring-hydroxylating ferredoxin subunit